MRRKTSEKIREQGGASSKLFWSNLGERKRKRRSIPRLKSKIRQVVESQQEMVGDPETGSNYRGIALLYG